VVRVMRLMCCPSRFQLVIGTEVMHEVKRAVDPHCSVVLDASPQGIPLWLFAHNGKDGVGLLAANRFRTGR
jgi:hypothetical protein